ncbi:MAG TPA: bifunctional DNA-formamidopyrimidine glycosylase/DNA-(apurinic or apyrimidinic site) lyase [Bryobacteraceae bacterium]
MPELPEVETVVRSLREVLPGRTAVRARCFSKLVTRGGLARTAAALAGRKVTGIRRRGKQIFIELDRGVLYVHLGMTGKLLWNGLPGKYARAIVEFDGGTLVYDDIRQFGRFQFFEKLPAALESDAPDALSATFEEFRNGLRLHRRSIKPLLLDQSFLAGVGNIYADEALFAARIHPRTAAGRLSDARARRLFDTLGQVLRAAIEHGGSSISDYVDSNGNRGWFQQSHCVYGREGQPCPVCGTAIRRMVLAQRSAHYCPRCQRV